MKPILTLAAALALTAVFAIPAPQAAPAGPQSTAPAVQIDTLAQSVGGNHHHGGHGYGYRRHRGPFFSFSFGAPFYGDSYYRPYYGYSDYSCRGWARECADRWGWRNYRWDRCVRSRGC